MNAEIRFKKRTVFLSDHDDTFDNIFFSVFLLLVTILNP